ncbi:MAG TPA: YiiX/YebB-like N1pC/P60 family cysteine hydrolase [Ferruginibacter sp.]|nr:YiiX/YebB-like N1pC/P60 family cysteine hydrolase [Ferruginibacter sp.]
MKFFIQKGIRWPLSRLIFLFINVGVWSIPVIGTMSCNQKEVLNPLLLSKQDSIETQQIINRAFSSINAIKPNIQSGDLITRTGNDFTSQSLRTLNRRNQTYSHCGVASIENDSLFIYHAIGGEWNPDEKLKRDPFELFAEPYSNNGIGVFRFNLPDTTRQQLIKAAQTYYAAGLKFDMDFDLTTDDRMYCAEFIYKSFLKASQQQMVFNKSNIGQFIFIGVDDIFLHPLCSKKSAIVYK